MRLTWMSAAMVLIACWRLCAYSQSASDLQLTIGVTKAMPVYRLGERIVLRMSFSTANPGLYRIQNNRESPGAQGYMPEVFSVSPSNGAIDPHVDINHDLGLPIGGSTLMGDNRFSSDPTILQTDLNKWVRFVKPGDYRIIAHSSRVSLRSESYFFPAAGHPLTLNSNEIKLTLLPADSGWIANEMDSISKTLDSPASTKDEKSIATARLRYLNTKSSVAKLIRELPETMGEDCHWELVEGLLESSWQKEAIDLLRKTLDVPEERVSWDAVDLLTKLTLRSRYRNRRLDYGTRDPQQLQALQAVIKKRLEKYRAVFDTYTAELKASLPKRRNRARTDALFAIWKDQEFHSRDFSSEALAVMRHQIVAIASDLTPSQQSWLLTMYWQNLPEHESLLPLVRRIALSNESWRMDFMTGNLRTAAMERWCELDAEGCHVR